MKKIVLGILLCTMFLSGCSLQNSNNDNKLPDSKSTEVAAQSNDIPEPKASTQDSSDASKQNSTNGASNQKTKSSKDSIKNRTYTEQNISEKVKEYIINGQGDKPEASKIKWSKSFLNKADIVSLYKQYVAKSGNSQDLAKFAAYMTSNAPILNDWQKLFEKDLNDIYEEKVVGLEHLNKDLYQAYVKKNNKEVPYVVVSARTGYFHG